MNILITGSFGYIGGRLAEHLFAANAGHELRLQGRTRRSWPFDWCRNSVFIQADLADPAVNLDAACDGVDVIIHLSAMNDRDSANDPVLATQVNVVGTQNLLNSAIKWGVKRFIYLSTAHVYGLASQAIVSETSHTCPTNPYAITHKAAEDFVLAASHQKKIEGVVLRLSNSFGAPVEPSVDCWRLVLNDLARQAILNNKIVMHSSGLQYRNFISLTDVCNTLTHFLTLPHVQLGDGLFNLGSDCTVPVIKMVHVLSECIKERTGKEVIVEVGDTPQPAAIQAFDYQSPRLKSLGLQPKSTIVAELHQLFSFIENHKGIFT